jgi:hypothetical protein
MIFALPYNPLLSFSYDSVKQPMQSPQAQFLRVLTSTLARPGIPRTGDGKPNLTAPASRMPDGEPEVRFIR